MFVPWAGQPAGGVASICERRRGCRAGHCRAGRQTAGRRRKRHRQTTDFEEYRAQSRGGKGIITMKTTEKTGAVGRRADCARRG